ncbi:MAG: aromatic ring-hydroxylating dioxygenase subunit alpha [Actinobacteria bacterium]|nr:aromatic ring-hydroxylating dioxygenase subunit alpha [Actinomycetota bacterium]
MSESTVVSESTDVAAPTLANYWHPIAESSDLTEQPKRFQLLGTELVGFRGPKGVSVFRDLCIHRGAALSLGWVTDGCITCPYHGWQYDSEGNCVKIPALPEGSNVPRKARAIAYKAQERYGLVWVALEDPAVAVPTWPENEYDDPAYHHHLSSRNIWRCSAGRAVENFMDFSHFPFVHPNLLAPPDQTEVPAVEMEKTDYGLMYAYDTVEPESPSSAEGDVVRFEYRYVKPFTVHVKKITPDGGITFVTLMASPRGEKETELFLTFVRNYALDEADALFDHFSNRVLEQDRRIVESQRPEEIPVSLREELHLKVPDASGIAFRRELATIGGVGEYKP